MFNGTTFPDMPGGGNREGQGGGYEKKPWQNNGGDGGWKKPWNGGNGGGGGKFQRKEEPLDPSIYLPYAVSGNKEAPPEILAKLKELVQFLSSKGFTLRTGCADPFELAADDCNPQRRERILPWKDFAEKESKLTWNSERAHAIAKQFHPTYDNMKKGVQHILGKNARLVLGDKMTSPARFLIVWTEDGVENSRAKTARTGLSGHIIAIATAAGVPVYNLGNPDAEKRLRDYIDQIS